MGTENFTQSGVEQVGHRVVRSSCQTALLIHFRLNGLAHAELTTFDVTLVQDRGAQLQGIRYRKDVIAMTQQASVTQLTTGLGIERRFRQHHEGFVPLMDQANFRILFDQIGDDVITGQLVVTNELTLLLNLQSLVVVDCKVGSSLASFPLLFHFSLEARFIDGVITIAHHISRQVSREAIGVI